MEATIRNQFTTSEITEYHHRKERIRIGLKSAMSIADDLIALRADKKKPWRLDGYANFAEFLQHEYGIGERRAQQVMAAKKLATAAPALKGVQEKAIREIKSLSAQGQTKIVEHAKASTGKPAEAITSNDVKNARRELAMEATSLAAADRMKAASDSKKEDKVQQAKAATQASRDKVVKHWKAWPPKLAAELRRGIALGLDPRAYTEVVALFNEMREMLAGRG